MSDELLVKYLLEEASEDERRSVEAWIGEGPENARHYRDFKTIWDESRRLAARSTVDVDAAWDRFRTRAAEEAAPAPTARKTFSLDTRFIMRLAAGLVLLIGGGLAIRYAAGSNSGEMLAIRSGAEATRATLPDGSVVTLNRNATLQYPEEFTGGTRSVTLDGEAFFEVAPDRSHPFISQ
jgi:ferric-dicitrate binding protein FerR (iron transport regulator)